MRYRRSESVAFRQLGDECLLVPVRTNPREEMAVFRLNEIGAFLWEALATPATAQQLVGRLAAEFEVAPAQAQADLEGFLKLLLAKGLIEKVEP
jgi:hypothetical protein